MSEQEREGLDVSPGFVMNESDTRAVTGLLGKAAVMSGDIAVRRRFVLEGLAKLVEAGFWGWLQCRGLRELPMPVGFNILTQEVRDPVKYNAMVAASFDPEAPVPEFVALKKLSFRHITRIRQDLVSDTEFYQSPSWTKHRRFIDYDQSLICLYKIGEPDTWSLFVCYRDVGRSAFTPRERFLVHLVTSEVEWLHVTGVETPNKESVRKLTPRQRQVFFCLLNGQTPKQIAENMKLSEHTVRDHVQAIYGHFGCSGRSELFAKFLGGGQEQGRADHTM